MYPREHVAGVAASGRRMGMNAAMRSCATMPKVAHRPQRVMRLQLDGWWNTARALVGKAREKWRRPSGHSASGRRHANARLFASEPPRTPLRRASSKRRSVNSLRAFTSSSSPQLPQNMYSQYRRDRRHVVRRDDTEQVPRIPVTPALVPRSAHPRT